MTRACKDCEFCAAPIGEDQLQCRHKSPLWAMSYPVPCPPDEDGFGSLPIPQNSRIWPRVNPDDWCGDFSARRFADERKATP